MTLEQATAAFTAWETGFRNKPEEFLTEAEVAAMEVAAVGEACAIYFMALLRDQGVTA